MTESADEFEEAIRTLLDMVSRKLPDIKSMYGEGSAQHVGAETLRGVLSMFLRNAGDFTATAGYAVLPKDKRTLVLPDDTVLAYVIMMRKGEGVEWYRVRGIASDAKVSGMYAKTTDANVLGEAVMDSILSDYFTNESCKTCPVRGDCRTLALFEFARGLVEAMVHDGYDPNNFVALLFAAMIFAQMENQAKVQEEGR